MDSSNLTQKKSIENEASYHKKERDVESYAEVLKESKNVIFRGAPGTGKSYLAKEIATHIVSNGKKRKYIDLSDEEKEQIEFVQFHPSYDYTDFVEGLRPIPNDNGSIGFERRNGVFMNFINEAKKNFENSQKTLEDMEKEAFVQKMIDNYFSDIEPDICELKTIRGKKFFITDLDNNQIKISIPDNEVSDKLALNKNDFKKMLISGKNFTQVKDVTQFLKKSRTQSDTYLLAIFKEIKARGIVESRPEVDQVIEKSYVFIIDEINRGEISKILGELFFSIDPGYRGKAGEVATQYANLHDDPKEKFYIPENVYLIGTMNDIDRSVDSFDFAMRRRFRFVEIKADKRLGMLNSLGDKKTEAIKRMKRLNQEISKVDELNENYHIGASYFLKVEKLTFDQLWTDYLLPLLQDYIRGIYDEKNTIKKFAKAYGYGEVEIGDANDEG